MASTTPAPTTTIGMEVMESLFLDSVEEEEVEEEWVETDPNKLKVGFFNNWSIHHGKNIDKYRLFFTYYEDFLSLSKKIRGW